MAKNSGRMEGVRSRYSWEWIDIQNLIEEIQLSPIKIKHPSSLILTISLQHPIQSNPTTLNPNPSNIIQTSSTQWEAINHQPSMTPGHDKNSSEGSCCSPAAAVRPRHLRPWLASSYLSPLAVAPATARRSPSAARRHRRSPAALPCLCFSVALPSLAAHRACYLVPRLRLSSQDPRPASAHASPPSRPRQLLLAGRPHVEGTREEAQLLR